jgi:hypothetical protein
VNAIPLFAVAELVSVIDAAAAWVSVIADSEDETVTTWLSESLV